MNLRRLLGTSSLSFMECSPLTSHLTLSVRSLISDGLNSLFPVSRLDFLIMAQLSFPSHSVLKPPSYYYKPLSKDRVILTFVPSIALRFTCSLRNPDGIDVRSPLKLRHQPQRMMCFSYGITKIVSSLIETTS